MDHNMISEEEWIKRTKEDLQKIVDDTLADLKDEVMISEAADDYSWLGPYRGKKSRRPDTRICSHCGAEVHQAWVYEDGLAFYCSEECLLQHFTADEWNSLVERAESPECLEPGLAYYMDYTGRRW